MLHLSLWFLNMIWELICQEECSGICNWQLWTCGASAIQLWLQNHLRWEAAGLWNLTDHQTPAELPKSHCIQQEIIWFWLEPYVTFTSQTKKRSENYKNPFPKIRFVFAFSLLLCPDYIPDHTPQSDSKEMIISGFGHAGLIKEVTIFCFTLCHIFQNIIVTSPACF